MSNILSVNIQNIRGISNLKINLSLTPDVYAITGVNGIGKSTLLTCITPRLHRPTSFDVLKGVATNESLIKYTIGDETETWKYDGSKWECEGNISSPLRGFQEGSLSNGTRFLNITSMGYRYYKQMLNIRSELLTEADSFVKESLGNILQNDKNYYNSLYRLDRSKAERYYKYKGVVYYLKIGDKYIPQFELSNGEFLLINLLHLLNNLLVRNNNSEKLNLILIIN